MTNHIDCSSVYENPMHWPPYTYRDYPLVTSESLQAFVDFLGTENTSSHRKELQPWIPFCTQKCNFCYFPTELMSKNEMNTYLEAMKKSLGMYSKTKYVQTSEFSEIYLAGGTPSIMSTEQTIDLLKFCEENFNISKDREIKVTGCTHDFDLKKLKALSEYGVDQLDLGIQTFDDKIRKLVNLRDNAKTAEEMIKTAHKFGLRVSIDLMYNLPGQDLKVWSSDVQKALDLNVESADCYALDVYPKTKIAEQLESGALPARGDQDDETEMYLQAAQTFNAAGYEKTCHNRFSRIKQDFQEPCMEVVGSGAGFFMGTVGKFSYVDISPAKDYITAVANGKFPISNLFVSSDADEMAKMMMRLYIRLPVNKSEFKEQFGKLPEEAFEQTITKLEKKGLIEIDEQEIRLTKLGDIWRYNVCWEFSPKKADTQ
ncbi:MAG: radical SAM protein [Candidatus Bathyarchaeota archaeon]|nr:radical SAM protein [Candidatus Bathyarchaeota archaeon]